MGKVYPSFLMLCQQQDHWCWAAVSSAVHSYPPDQPPITQCQMATRMLPGNCCLNPEPCDIEFSLSQALGDRLGEFINAQVSFEYIQYEINVSRRPVGVRIVWDTNGDWIGDGAHFVVIDGYRVRNGVQYVSVQDPEGGGQSDGLPANSLEIPFEQFRRRYRDVGIWVQTYIFT